KTVSMTKIANKSVLALAALCLTSAAIAQTDTTKKPLPDTLRIPSTPTDTIPTDTSATAGLQMVNNAEAAANVLHSFYIRPQQIASSKMRYDLKKEGETGA